jgi:hypothetical protein
VLPEIYTELMPVTPHCANPQQKLTATVLHYTWRVIIVDFQVRENPKFIN